MFNMERITDADPQKPRIVRRKRFQKSFELKTRGIFQHQNIFIRIIERIEVRARALERGQDFLFNHSKITGIGSGIKFDNDNSVIQVIFQMTRREKIDDVIRAGGFLSGNQGVHDIADLRAFVRSGFEHSVPVL